MHGLGPGCSGNAGNGGEKGGLADPLRGRGPAKGGEVVACGDCDKGPGVGVWGKSLKDAVSERTRL